MKTKARINRKNSSNLPFQDRIRGEQRKPGLPERQEMKNWRRNGKRAKRKARKKIESLHGESPP